MLEGRKSQLMTPGSEDSGAPARSRRAAWIKALVIEIYPELRAAKWSVAKASGEIAKVLKDAGKKDITASKVQDIISQSRKKDNKEPRLVLEIRAAIRRNLDDFKNQAFKRVGTTTSIDTRPSRVFGYFRTVVTQLETVEEYDPGDDIRCEVLLASLAREARALTCAA